MIDMRKALFAVCPRLKLVTDIFTPRIRESPAKDMNDNIENLFSDIKGLFAKNRCLNEAMDRQNSITCVLVHETSS
jgi:hypothetical protein